VHRIAYAHRVKLVRIGSECDFDVSQTASPSHLRKRPQTKLFCTAQATNSWVAQVPSNHASKTRPLYELHRLSEQRLANIHSASARVRTLENDMKMKIQNSKFKSALNEKDRKPAPILAWTAFKPVLIGHYWLKIFNKFRASYAVIGPNVAPGLRR
jgi:hypothetical protein